MYPGQIHRLNQARKAAELQQQQPIQQSGFPVQQQSMPIMTPDAANRMTQQHVSNHILQFSIKAKKLKAADWNGKSDPYLEFYRLESTGWTKVHTTPVQYKTLKPTWTGLTIALDTLCYGDRNRPILLRCFDYDQGADPDHLGDCQFNVQDLLNSSKFQLDLKPALSSMSSRSTGHLTFFDVSISTSVSPNPATTMISAPKPQQTPKAAGAYPLGVYSAGIGTPISTIGYGSGQNHPITITPPQQQQSAAAPITSQSFQSQGIATGQSAYSSNFNQPALYTTGSIGQKSPMFTSGVVPVSQTIYTSKVAPTQPVYTSNLAPVVGQSVCTSNMAPLGGQPVYTSNIAPIGQPAFASNVSCSSNNVSCSSNNVSCSRPASSASQLPDNLPPPPSYDELFRP